ncbi:hypothetical protein ANN_01648 [Periplaneta americana]|uniref:Per a allergen n=1 Tax=Periplaneta americana TaxID=6978 RepID=A0ABQ8TXI8_PERAM|nr:hypothetical protein ANN_01648 [Periplaneta americana]
MSPGSSAESYPAFAHIGLRENPGKTSTSKKIIDVREVYRGDMPKQKPSEALIGKYIDITAFRLVWFPAEIESLKYCPITSWTKKMAELAVDCISEANRQLSETKKSYSDKS